VDVLPVVALDHVGLAAAGAGTPLTQLLGAAALTGHAMPSGVTVARFGPAATLELVWPGRPGTPVDGFLERRGPGLHHVALRVDEDLAAVAGALRAAGGVLVELVQGPRP
jgi:hypothetical protein